MKMWRTSSVGLAVVIALPLLCPAQSRAQSQAAPAPERTIRSSEDASSAANETEKAKEQLQQGTVLTRQGRFKQAIPHLLAARETLPNVYGLEFNLGLCYLGDAEYEKAISILDGLRQKGRDNADVENLLAQAYIGNGKKDDALAALERAAAISPQNERLFAFVADACSDTQDFELGLKVIEIGLKNLPQSARLHYQKAVLLSQLDQFDRAKPDFELAKKFGQGSEVAYLAAGQEALLEGNVSDGIRIAREAISKGMQNSALLVILGKALLRSGITPGQPEFVEAQNALEKAVTEHPNDAGSQIALGQIYLMDGRLDEAIAHLQAARKLRPDQPSVYASLGKAYQRKGDTHGAEEAFAKLESLNQAQAQRIQSAPGERKLSYGGEPAPPQ